MPNRKVKLLGNTFVQLPEELGCLLLGNLGRGRLVQVHLPVTGSSISYLVVIASLRILAAL
jgi:hypothetical protein